MDNKNSNPGLYERRDYKSIWRGRSRQKLDNLEQLILRSRMPKSGKRILDLGCGFGRLAACYQDAFEQVVFFDGALSLLQQAKKDTGGRGVYVAGDVNCPPFRAGSFDCVLMMRVLHHQAEPRTSLMEVGRILCDEGTFIFNFHNRCNPWRTVKRMLGPNRLNKFACDVEKYTASLYGMSPQIIEKHLEEARLAPLEYYGEGVFDKISERLGVLGGLIPEGLLLAGLFGRTKIAPVILCVTRKSEGIPLFSSNDLIELLICPGCQGELIHGADLLSCSKCHRTFETVDGIFDMRLTD